MANTSKTIRLDESQLPPRKPGLFQDTVSLSGLLINWAIVGAACLRALEILYVIGIDQIVRPADIVELVRSFFLSIFLVAVCLVVTIATPYIISINLPGNQANEELNKRSETKSGYNLSTIIVAILSGIFIFIDYILWSDLLLGDQQTRNDVLVLPMMAVTYIVTTLIPAWYWSRIMAPDYLVRMMSLFQAKQIATDIDLTLRSDVSKMVPMRMRLYLQVAATARENNEELADFMVKQWNELVRSIKISVKGMGIEQEMWEGEMGLPKQAEMLKEITRLIEDGGDRATEEYNTIAQESFHENRRGRP